MSTAVPSRFVARPTPGLLLRRIFRSSDGKLVAFGLVLVPAILVGAVGPVAGIAVGVVLLIGVAWVLARTRLEVTRDQVVIANLLRIHRLSGGQIANVVIQTVNYQSSGATMTQTHRLVVVTTEVDGKTGQPVVVPAFATERRARDVVERMLREVAPAIRP